MSLPAVTQREHRRLVRFFSILPVVLGAISVVVGILGLVAWAFGREDITAMVSPGMPMAPLTAACIVVAGIALIIAPKDTPLFIWTTRLLAFLIGLASLGVLVEYVFDVRTLLDTTVLSVFGRNVEGHDTRHTGVNTAVALIFIAQGLFLLASERKARKMRSQLFATLALIIAFIAVVGHMFGVKDFYSFQLLSGMSLS